MKFYDKIVIGLIAIYLLICLIDILPKEDRPVDPEIGRELVIEHLNEVARERERLRREQNNN